MVSVYFTGASGVRSDHGPSPQQGSLATGLATLSSEEAGGGADGCCKGAAGGHGWRRFDAIFNLRRRTER